MLCVACGLLEVTGNVPGDCTSMYWVYSVSIHIIFHLNNIFFAENQEANDSDKSTGQSSEDTKPSPAEEKPRAKFELLHDVAAFHALAMVKNKERAHLVRNIGPFRRALCARKDIMMRRALCKAGKVTNSAASEKYIFVELECVTEGYWVREIDGNSNGRFHSLQ